MAYSKANAVTVNSKITEELYKAQEKIAGCFATAYINLKELPEVSEKIRMTAHAARSQHMSTSGLMKEFMVSAAHISQTVIPMILDAVESMDTDIIVELFDQLLEDAKSMIDKSTEAKSGYLSICNKVQANCEQIDQKLKLLGQKERELERELRQCKEIAQCITDKLEKTKEELRNLETQLESYVNGESSSRLDRIENELKARIREKKMDLEKFKLEQNQTENKSRRLHKQKEECLANQRVLCQTESLKQTLSHIKEAETQIQGMIGFWNNVIATVEYLKEEVQVGGSHKQKLTNPKYAAGFNKYIGEGEKEWARLGSICSDYARKCDSNLISLYKFLSCPTDNAYSYTRNAGACTKDELML